MLRMLSKLWNSLVYWSSGPNLAFGIRHDRLDHNWMQWTAHAEQIIHKGLFGNEYAMSYEAFL